MKPWIVVEAFPVEVVVAFKVTEVWVRDEVARPGVTDTVGAVILSVVKERMDPVEVPALLTL